MISYLDTQVAVWLASGTLKRLTPASIAALTNFQLIISSVVLLELEYLFEIGRLKLRADDILLKLKTEAGVAVCELSLASVGKVALNEKWTRDPFDRLIVSNAKANGFAALITSDELIRENYPRAIW
ncbi:MAG: PIN domain-containing protein [Bryobacteraceae bacterium]|nr:PIN domain-containing protein [Bryobacteraceae bacterium]